MRQLYSNVILAHALSFPMDHILDRYVKDTNVTPEVARQHELELKRFLALGALNPSKSYGMAGPVDELWHLFITYTREYARFCQDVAGHFIHHVPTDPNAKGDSRSYESFLADYALAYGVEPAASVWPRLALAECAQCERAISCGKVTCEQSVRVDCGAGCQSQVRA